MTTLTSRRVAMGGVAFYLAALAALHVLRPDDIERYGNTLSAYSVGRYGELSVAAFLALGARGLAVARGLRATLEPSRAMRAGTASVGACVVCFGVAGVFRCAPDGASIVPLIEGRRPPTAAGIVHGVAGFAGFGCLMTGMLLLSGALRRAEPRRGVRTVMTAIAVAAPALAIGGLVAPNPPVTAWAEGGWVGAVESRIFIASLAAWVLLAARRVVPQPMLVVDGARLSRIASASSSSVERIPEAAR